jgi:5-methylcytosine-specific restriction endonuclease McrA
VNGVGSKQPRLRLDADSYGQVYEQVLERDSWRCQLCGSTRSLQVHHKRLRSHSGGDIEDNLITLCDRCHRLTHSATVSLR